ncbi:19537_t:CDS:2, partial [Rhizophagus irregularis]
EKSGKWYHSDIESSDSEKPEAKRSIPNIKPTKKQKPTLIDFVEDEERNIGIFQYTYVIMPEFIISPNDYEFKVLDKEKRTKRRQSELMKGQKGQKSSEQVEELSQLIKKITKGKQKAANPKDIIIDWSGVETSDSPEKCQYVSRSPKKN